MSQKGKAVPEELDNKGRKNKYPNSFLFGCVSGVILNMCSRVGSQEPLHARPFTYITTAMVMGVGIFYYDYWRRRAIEEIMYGEERHKYHMTLKALNQVRPGEEEEITNFMEYMANTTVRE